VKGVGDYRLEYVEEQGQESVATCYIDVCIILERVKHLDRDWFNENATKRAQLNKHNKNNIAHLQQQWQRVTRNNSWLVSNC